MSDTISQPDHTVSLDKFCLGWDNEPARLSDVARRRRDEIMDAAEAIIANHGIDKLSLAQIEQRAGMSRGQLTYYFPTRESILLAVYERMLRRMIRERLDGDGPKPMTGQAWECFQHALSMHLGLDPANRPQERKNLYSLLYTFLAQMGHREDYRNRLSAMYGGWRDDIAADVAHSVPGTTPEDSKVAATLLLALINGLTVQLMVDPQAFDPETVHAACVRMLAPLFDKKTAPEPNPT